MSQVKLLAEFSQLFIKVGSTEQTMALLRFEHFAPALFGTVAFPRSTNLVADAVTAFHDIITHTPQLHSILPVLKAFDYHVQAACALSFYAKHSGLKSTSADKLIAGLQDMWDSNQQAQKIALSWWRRRLFRKRGAKYSDLYAQAQANVRNAAAQVIKETPMHMRPASYAALYSLLPSMVRRDVPTIDRLLKMRGSVC